MATTTLYRSRSGRLHAIRTCSGGITPRTATKVTLTDEELAAVPKDTYLISRCAWSRLDQAKARVSV